MNNKISIYLASGWFTPRTKSILDDLETLLSSREDLEVYSPRRDGVMLPPNQKHDTKLRERVFEDNLEHILGADLVIANIDSVDSYNDTGTIYEVGFATANNIPVVGYTLSDENISQRFKGTIDCFECILKGLDEVSSFFDEISSPEKSPEESSNPKKILFVGAGNDTVDKKIVSYILDNGYRIRWINEDNSNIYNNIEEVFEGIDFMVAVIDDRKTLVSWMLGQAYARKVPIVTYSDNDYGVNLMLACSLKTHLKGSEELVNLLQTVKHSGLDSIPDYDISVFKVM